ncbi:hypothetical protein [Enterovibrio norvegicus]|uniref:hypothetical protein n=1 Tax=Enterovibrio norvegicus TaxID=188144 RepID=UPI001E393073|nr:hypothetical protein [Enterovibrio norvegicus]MCC4796987.1 hypothetical protein [Enterovibrio norvegicus]
MRQKHTLTQGQAIDVSAGQNGRYLIMREATDTVSLRSDNLRPVEIERGDTVDVSDYDTLTITNHHDSTLSLEFQITDIPVITRAQKIGANNLIGIDRIEEPVKVSEILEPVTVGGVIDTRIKDPVSLRAIGSGVLTFESNTLTIDGDDNRRSLVLQAADTNTESIVIQGVLRLRSGGDTTINTRDSITLSGAQGDVIYVGELV